MILAQSIYITEESGVFVTALELFFTSINTTIPVSVNIRTMSAGSPTSTILPNSEISTLGNTTGGTKFVFNEPVYLSPYQSYALCVQSQSTDYFVKVARIYEIDSDDSSRRIDKQPALGSLLKSSDGVTWTAAQEADMKFNLYRAEFKTGEHTLDLNTSPLPLKRLTDNPISLVMSDNSVRVYDPYHGFNVSDSVSISGGDESQGGVMSDGIKLNGDHSITKVDWSGYSFPARDNNSGLPIDVTADDTGLGGSEVLVTQHKIFNTVVPVIDNIVPESSKLTIRSTFDEGEKSYSQRNNRATSLVGGGFTDSLVLGENNDFDIPRKIATTGKVTLTMSTENPLVTPTVDLQRAGLVLVDNIVDKPSATADSGFNIPLDFVAETDASGGTSASKHITKVVTLSATASSLRIIVGANVPSVAGFDVYYRVLESDGSVPINELAWIKAELPITNRVQTDEVSTVFRDYEYNVNTAEFTQFQIKLVFNSTNSARVPVIRDLRVIAID